MIKLIDKLSNTKKLVILTISLFVIFICLNYSSALIFNNSKLDITQNKFFSLTPTTIEIIKKQTSPININLYFSEELTFNNPENSIYANQIIKLLDFYKKYSNDKINYKIIDPKPFSNQELEAISKGVKGIAYGDQQISQYFGLTIENANNQIKTIPYLFSNRAPYFEYDITKAIYNLSISKKKHIGIITQGMKIRSDDIPFITHKKINTNYKEWQFLSYLSENYKVSHFSKFIREIPDNIDLLILLNPKNPPEMSKYAIDQYLVRGGKLIVFLDSYSKSENNQKGYHPIAYPKIDSFLRNLDISYSSKHVITDIDLANKITVIDNKTKNQTSIDHLTWLTLGKDNINQELPFSKELNNINLGFTGEITINNFYTDLNVTPILWSSENTGILATSSIRKDITPTGIYKTFKNTKQKRNFAVLIEGKINSNFISEIDFSYSKSLKHPHQNKAEKATKVIVFADSDMLNDNMWIVKNPQIPSIYSSIPISNNVELLINSIEYLTNNPLISQLRSKNTNSTNMSYFENLRSKLSEQYIVEETNLISKIKTNNSKLSKLISNTNQEDIDIEAIEHIQQKQNQLKQSYKELQYIQNKEIELTKNLIKSFNIWLLPFLLLIALFITISKRNKEK